jgi:uncharacterized alkaline shock family protein YloU
MADSKQNPQTPVPQPPTYPVSEERPEEESELGLIHIHNGVIAVIARLAAVKVPGVVDLVGSIVDGIAGMVGRKPNDRGVHVEIVDNGIVIEMNLIVEYGVNIPKVAWQVQTEVRQAVEQMTGKPVKGVNIVVQSIQMPKAETAAPEKEPGE